MKNTSSWTCLPRMLSEFSNPQELNSPHVTYCSRQVLQEHYHRACFGGASKCRGKMSRLPAQFNFKTPERGVKEVSSVYVSVIDLSILYSLWKVVLENQSCPVVIQSLQRAQVRRTCMSGSEA